MRLWVCPEGHEQLGPQNKGCAQCRELERIERFGPERFFKCKTLFKFENGRPKPKDTP